VKFRLGPRGPRILNVYLFLKVAGYCGWRLY
jgi:hypothetical protein